MHLFEAVLVGSAQLKTEETGRAQNGAHDVRPPGLMRKMFFFFFLQLLVLQIQSAALCNKSVMQPQSFTYQFKKPTPISHLLLHATLRQTVFTPLDLRVFNGAQQCLFYTC